jgi:outer membrane immunogenic protein
MLLISKFVRACHQLNSFNPERYRRDVMKRHVGLFVLFALMMPAAAQAADMRVKAPPAPPPPPPPFSWNGFYIGGELGGAFANGTISDSLFGLSVSTNHDGFLGGGVVGFNYQVSNVVWGVEGDFDGTSLSVTGNGIPTALGTLQASANTDWIASLTGRIGFASDRVLYYVKGGGGWVRNTASISNLTTNASVSASNSRGGWLIGGGLEWAFESNWSTKIEYDYLALNSFSWNSVLFPGETFTASRNISMVKAGLNFRFGGSPAAAPVVSKY